MFADAKTVFCQVSRSLQSVLTRSAKLLIAFVVESDDLSKHSATANGKFVVLLGVMNARGQVEVKHKVFGSDVKCDEVTSNTVINGALSNLYSNEAKAAQQAKKREEDEQKATSLNDIQSSSNASTVDFDQAA